MACLLTPIRLASRSRLSIIHAGISTLMRFGSSLCRRAPETSRCSMTFCPSSKASSNSEAFIQCPFFIPCSSHRDYPDFSSTRRHDGRPDLACIHSQYYRSGLIHHPGWYFKQVWIIPDTLRFFKVDPVFGKVQRALLGIKFEFNITSIPQILLFNLHILLGTLDGSRLNGVQRKHNASRYR